MSTSPKPQITVLWAQVWGLALVQGAIALTWVIYTLYLPQLLGQFGLPKVFATGLLVVESLLGMVMEPLMGGLSDRAQRWMGSRFPFVALGVILSSALFIAIPAIVIFWGTTAIVLRWLFIGVLIAWALSMTVFRSPALSLLGRYAFATNLPQAASILTLMGALAGATGALANQYLLSLGPAVTFATGSCVMLVAATALRLVNPQQEVRSEPAKTPDASGKLSIAKLGWIFGTGVGVALGFKLMQGLLSFAAPQAGTGLLTVFTVVHILTILPVGWLAVQLGNQLAMLLGAGTLATALALLAFTYSTPLAVGLAAALGISFSLIANGTIPFALSQVPPSKAGLGTGVYFSGSALAVSALGAVSIRFGTITPNIAAIVGAIAFLGAGLCIAASQSLKKS